MVPNEVLFKTLLDNLSEGVYFVDLERRIQYWNKGAEHITGYGAEEVIGHRCADNILVHVDDRGKPLCQDHCPLYATLTDRQPRQARVFLKHKDGQRLPVHVSISAIEGENGTVAGGVETFLDDSPLMAAIKEVEDLRQISLLCPLTGVGNRRFSEQILGQKLDEMRRRDTRLGVFFMDIDHFKKFNDHYGHAVGDIVLKMAARTLANTMRSYDFLGRWGGEEFIAVAPNIHHIELQELGERFRALVETSTRTISKDQLRVTMSVGATLSRTDDTVSAIVARADKLMYESKQRGRNRVTVDTNDRIAAESAT